MRVLPCLQGKREKSSCKLVPQTRRLDWTQKGSPEQGSETLLDELMSSVYPAAATNNPFFMKSVWGFTCGAFEDLSYGLGRRRDDGHRRPGCVDHVDI